MRPAGDGPGRQRVSLDDFHVIDLPEFRDSRGLLVPVEFSRFVPFAVQRMFWINDVPAGGVRGGHAHKYCHQFAICVTGLVSIEAYNGEAKRTVELRAGQAAHIKPRIFTTERFVAPGSILSVLCDRPYDAVDYLYELK
jgi:dTDP-4-dehydrorhamnose 3,5-epimerase-like enzyme